MNGSALDQQAMFSFVQGLLNIVTSGPFWALMGPIFILVLIIRLMKWSYSAGSGEKDLDALGDAVDYRAAQIRSRISGSSAPSSNRPGARYRR